MPQVNSAADAGRIDDQVVGCGDSALEFRPGHHGEHGLGAVEQGQIGKNDALARKICRDLGVTEP